MSLNARHALVLLSGGQDSATCLAIALERFELVETVGFDYGQRHGVELAARDRVRSFMARGRNGGRLGRDHRLDVPAFAQIGDTAMTAEVSIETDARGLPTTFVPGRNLVFLSFAGALACRRGIGTVIGGMCETDAAGYPDCRSDTLEAMGNAMTFGIHEDLTLETPLLRLSKAETWALAEEVGGTALVDLIVEETHTCYLGQRDVRHEWGYGCGTCPACIERARGWRAYVQKRSGAAPL